MSTTKMERSPERWAGMDPVVVADGSGAQIRWVIQDAKHDIAFLLQDLAAHEASNRIKTENLETLREQNAKLREALGSVLSDYQTTLRVNCRCDEEFIANQTAAARAALGESE